MKIVADISTTSRLMLAGGSGTLIVITAGVPPALGPLRDGDSVQAALSPGALDPGNYASTAGAISGVSGTVTINGTAGALSDVVRHDDVVSVVVTASDDAGNARDFAAGSRIVAGIAPTIAASDSLSGRTLTISVDGTTGVPAPGTVLTALTLDGVDVAADISGADPWLYETPSSTSDQTVAWTLTTTNAEGSATASGTELIAADLFAPVAQTAPQITGTPAPGSTVTITQGTYSGTPPATLTGTLTLDGGDVTADLVGLDYEIPASAVPGVALVYAETASNGIAPDAQQSASVTVAAAETALLDIHPGAAGAWSLRKLSSGAGDVVRVRRSSDSAQANFSADDVAGGALEAWVGAGNDGFVVTLFDQSGTASHATQATAAAQPRVVISGALVTENGVPAIRCNGTSQFLSADASISFSSGGALFALLRHENTQWGLGAHGGQRLYVGEVGSGVSDRFASQTDLSQTGIRRIYTLSFADGTADFFSNGQPGTSFGYAASGVSASPFGFGARLLPDRSGFNGFMQGTISEVILYPADQSLNRSDIEQDIADHHAITLA